ncbi:MAG: hypothetical protein M3H12_07830 [Chromatiales bacterium]
MEIGTTDPDHQPELLRMVESLTSSMNRLATKVAKIEARGNHARLRRYLWTQNDRTIDDPTR